jgi:SAM-dependent methyltransferase
MVDLQFSSWNPVVRRLRLIAAAAMKKHPRPDGLRDTYDRIAGDWARDHESDTWWRACTARFASLLPDGARLLDAGCGSGQKAKFFQDLGLRVMGIDFSERLLDIARQTATASDFRLLDLRDIGTLSEEFEGVFAQASLLHIPKAETFAVIEGMVSRLVPRGLLYVAVKAQRAGSPEEEIVAESDYGYDYERFFSYYTLDEMRAYLDRLGLSLVHAEVSQVSLEPGWMQVIARKPS